VSHSEAQRELLHMILERINSLQVSVDTIDVRTEKMAAMMGIREGSRPRRRRSLPWVSGRGSTVRGFCATRRRFVADAAARISRAWPTSWG
jgi:hypothetical protein